MPTLSSVIQVAQETFISSGPRYLIPAIFAPTAKLRNLRKSALLYGYALAATQLPFTSDLASTFYWLHTIALCTHVSIFQCLTAPSNCSYIAVFCMFNMHGTRSLTHKFLFTGITLLQTVTALHWHQHKHLPVPARSPVLPSTSQSCLRIPGHVAYRYTLSTFPHRMTHMHYLSLCHSIHHVSALYVALHNSNSYLLCLNTRARTCVVVACACYCTCLLGSVAICSCSHNT